MKILEVLRTSVYVVVFVSGVLMFRTTIVASASLLGITTSNKKLLVTR